MLFLLLSVFDVWTDELRRRRPKRSSENSCSKISLKLSHVWCFVVQCALYNQMMIPSNVGANYKHTSTLTYRPKYLRVRRNLHVINKAMIFTVDENDFRMYKVVIILRVRWLLNSSHIKGVDRVNQNVTLFCCCVVVIGWSTGTHETNSNRNTKTTQRNYRVSEIICV